MKKHFTRKRRAAQLHSVAVFGLALLSILLLPALLAAVFCAPETGLLCAAAGLPLVCLSDDDGGGGGGVSGLPLALKKTGEALSWVSDRIKAIDSKVGLAEGRLDALGGQVTELRKSRLADAITGSGDSRVRNGKGLSETAARELAAVFIIVKAKSGELDSCVPDAGKRASIYDAACSTLNISGRNLSTAEVPLPTTYGGALRELIAEFGVVRKGMFSYPLSGGVDKPPRMGTRPAFGSIAMAAEFPELKPAFGFASLEPHKIGGIVIPPREIDDQSIVPLGQFLAMYGAVEFARAEDTWGFLADGSATYENVKGVCQIASENDKAVTLAAGKTKPSDATLVNFRALRTKVSTAALGRGASYYISRSWETVMRSFNSANDLVFVYRPDGTATLDGFPIVWTEVLQPYSDDAAAAKMLAAFGRLDFWWFGERGTPRIDTSAHVFFRNDLLATRFIEEIDFDYCALDAMSVLKTPAA